MGTIFSEVKETLALIAQRVSWTIYLGLRSLCLTTIKTGKRTPKSLSDSMSLSSNQTLINQNRRRPLSWKCSFPCSLTQVTCSDPQTVRLPQRQARIERKKKGLVRS